MHHEFDAEGARPGVIMSSPLPEVSVKDRLVAAASWVALVLGVAFFVYVLRGDLLEPVPTPRPVLDHFLAMVAIVFGIVAIVYERELHLGFEKQKKEINDIVLAVHTRHLGAWPDHLRDITSLLSRAAADDELWILVDHIGYGHYSRPDDFERYLDGLESARNRGVSVRLLTYAEKQANEGVRRQFKEETFALDSPEVQAYFSRYSGIMSGRPANYDQFIDYALALENHFCEQLILKRLVKHPIEIRTLNDGGDEDAFFWMRRRGSTEIEVVFAYPKFGSGQKGHAFISRDSHLMDEFAARFEDKWKSHSAAAESPMYRTAHYAVSAFAARSSTFSGLQGQV